MVYRSMNVFDLTHPYRDGQDIRGLPWNLEYVQMLYLERHIERHGPKTIFRIPTSSVAHRR